MQTQPGTEKVKVRVRTISGDHVFYIAVDSVSKCIIDESMTLHESLAYALWSASYCPVGQEMKWKLWLCMQAIFCVDETDGGDEKRSCIMKLEE